MDNMFSNFRTGDDDSTSPKGFIFGVVCFIASFNVLWYNEGRSVHRAQALEAGRSAVVLVNADKVNTNHNQSLIHTTGMATTDEILSDDMFGVKTNALMLNRIAEMYQWKEKKVTKKRRSSNGTYHTTTQYKYNKEWHKHVINSENFRQPEGHQNPTSMPYQSKHMLANHISVGDFELTKAFKNQLDKAKEPYQLSAEKLDDINTNTQNAFQLYNNAYYSGNAQSPEIGALRIRYTFVNPQDVSIIGQQNGNQIETYATKTGPLNLLAFGKQSADHMFNEAEQENKITTWAMRMGGLILMYAGLYMLFSPILALTRFVPVLSIIVDASISFVCGIMATSLTLITIALAWLYYRPLLGIALLAVAFTLMFMGFQSIKRKRRAQNRESTNTVSGVSVDQKKQSNHKPDQKKSSHTQPNDDLIVR